MGTKSTAVSHFLRLLGALVPLKLAMWWEARQEARDRKAAVVEQTHILLAEIQDLQLRLRLFEACDALTGPPIYDAWIQGIRAGIAVRTIRTPTSVMDPSVGLSLEQAETMVKHWSAVRDSLRKTVGDISWVTFSG